MTLEEGVVRLRTRLNVDLEAEIDVDDNELCALALMRGAQKVSRAAYLFPVWEADFNLTADEPIYITTAACPTDLIFEVEEVHINGQWLEMLTPAQFRRSVGDYHSESSHSNPGIWMKYGPDSIRISQPPNSTAVAASDNFVKGWGLHPLWGYGNKHGTEMLGPEIAHDLYVNRAVLDNSVGNVSSDEGIKRRREIEREYSLLIYGGRDAAGNIVQGLKDQNLEQYKPLMREHRAGQRRRLFGIGHRR